MANATPTEMVVGSCGGIAIVLRSNDLYAIISDGFPWSIRFLIVDANAIKNKTVNIATKIIEW